VKLREERLLNFEKLVSISGDVSEKGLRLSAADRQMLVERVTIIVHAAASMRFNNNLKYVLYYTYYYIIYHLFFTKATKDICILT